jgi:hypothetical protein
MFLKIYTICIYLKDTIILFFLLGNFDLGMKPDAAHMCCVNRPKCPQFEVAM